jgi:hypothetical protein
MIGDTVLMNPPNTGASVERVWMFVSRDELGKENVCGFITALGATPMITGNPDKLENFKILAREIAATATGKTIHLLTFSNREELEGWR